jgi:hypothetical protein
LFIASPITAARVAQPLDPAIVIYRLVAKGPAEHAITIYMYSLQAEEVD